MVFIVFSYCLQWNFRRYNTAQSGFQTAITCLLANFSELCTNILSWNIRKLISCSFLAVETAISVERAHLGMLLKCWHWFRYNSGRRSSCVLQFNVACEIALFPISYVAFALLVLFYWWGLCSSSYGMKYFLQAHLLLTSLSNNHSMITWLIICATFISNGNNL